MWRISKPLLITLLLAVAYTRYLEMGLVRRAPTKEKAKLDAIQCTPADKINQDADYKEICYEKDIAYTIPFVHNGSITYLAADFTTPISWLKGPDCVVEGTKHLCSPITGSIVQKVSRTKKQMMKKFHDMRKKRHHNDEDSASQQDTEQDTKQDTKQNKKGKDEDKQEQQNAIIQGSSQIIRGQFERAKSLTFVIKDSNRLNNFFQLIMLGLFILGERDSVLLEDANFIDATSISANLNSRSDGAISLRFDNFSQRSFLEQIFKYVRASQKTVTVYLGQRNTLTIGELTSKYTQSGFSSIQWIDMPDNEGYGRMAEVTDIGIEDLTEDKQQDNDQTLPAVITLGASYIGLPQATFSQIISGSIGKVASCLFNNVTLLAECTFKNKRDQNKLFQKNIYFSFNGKNIVLPFKDLLLQQQSKKATLNIKQASGSHIILGEPVFKHYTFLFDYSKNRVGFAARRETFQQFFVSVVSLVRFLCLVFVIGCSFIICYGPCRKMIKVLIEKRWYRRGVGPQGQRLKAYEPIQQNPYDDLRGKMQDAITLAQREDVEGI